MTTVTIDAELLWSGLGDVPDLLGVWPDEQAAWLLEAASLEDPSAHLDAQVWPTLVDAGPEERGHHLSSGLRALVAAGQADVDGGAWVPLDVAALVRGLFVEAEHVGALALVRWDTAGPLPLLLARLVRVGGRVVAVLQEVDTEAGFHRLLVARPDVVAEQVAACIVTGSAHAVDDGLPDEVPIEAVARTLGAAGPLERGARLELHEDEDHLEPRIRVVSFTAVVDGPVWLADPVPAEDGAAPSRARLVPLTDESAFETARQLVTRWVDERLS